jgi:hypothetical protein
MEPAKTPEPRQREQEADHEQEHERMKGHNDPRCLKWGKGRARYILRKDKESLPCCQASGRVSELSTTVWGSTQRSLGHSKHHRQASPGARHTERGSAGPGLV